MEAVNSVGNGGTFTANLFMQVAHEKQHREALLPDFTKSWHEYDDKYKPESIRLMKISGSMANSRKGRAKTTSTYLAKPSIWERREYAWSARSR